MPLFQYLPLTSHDTIRILLLEPGFSNDPIKCTTREVTLTSAAGQYEAVSYAWGEQVPTINITCDQQELFVTAIVESLLRRFRFEEKSRSIWLDSICINQKDKAEKSHQVKRMGDVFRDAKRVLCWLGNDNESIAEKCFSLVSRAMQRLKEEWQEGWGLDNLTSDVKLTGLENNKDWDKVGRLLDLTWFKRVWVVQESGLARECNLYWGRYEIPLYKVLEVVCWLKFSKYAPILKEANTAVAPVLTVFTNIMCTYCNKPTWRDMTLSAKVVEEVLPLKRKRYVDLLFSARSLQATDQRDIVYSSLGSPLAYYEDGKPMVDPDYNEPLSSLQSKTAIALLRNPREAPYVLLFVTHDSKADVEDDDVPSWAPRWKTFGKSSACPIPLTKNHEYHQMPYRASGCSATFEYLILPGGILTVMGWRFDILNWTSSRLKPAHLRSNIDKWDPHFRDSKTPPIEHESLRLLQHDSSWRPGEILELLSFTLAGGRPESRDHVDDFSAYCKSVRDKVGTRRISPFPLPSSSKGDAQVAERAMRRAGDRRLALTAQRRMALVPLVAEAGDICCIVQGMNIPLVLREISTGMYRCIGELYCSGVMEGELLEQHGSEAPPWEQIRLR
ncbi:heterokaryon incompatibility protein-domain-containing protein [Hypoxylon trugodes]|uniref:heterokaryon incompatibility protein-domain-containing protein n=1 Tax=Hypoxylon trugodes TaxID=326681 RepID=UPI0021930204|nr:heterokaryon incompatibility protein-domain-containing protein [Hypoxylon trugodes]KAI1394361.1 heterokaryon incompatibility protein-domain-containing protein [Hypoxylon trugodes]